MKTALKALTFAALLTVPASALAHDYDRYDRWRAGRSRVAENFEREHPRWPRVYCHTHRFPLHQDDTREHCHNWNRQSWEEARLRWTGGYGGWYGYDRRDDRWRRARYETDRRRGWWWDRYRD
jgi:hypothetical protein